MSELSTRDRKSIGPEWLGDVPANWDVTVLKRVATLFSGGTPDRENQDYWDEGTIPWLNSGAVNQWHITEPSAFITEEGFRNSSAKWIPKNALVMALAGQGKTKGMVAQVAIETTCNQSMAAIVPNEKVYSRFLLWWLSANYETIRNLAGGEQRDGLNLEIVGGIPCPIPAVGQQGAISDYLDRETERLDGLVAAKKRVLGLLAEKRRALVTGAVTRGLDPRAPLRDSGIPWLGEIPAHWEVKKIKHVAALKSGEFITSESIAPVGEYPVFGGNGVRGFSSSFTHEGDHVLIGRQGALCGNINYASGRFWASEHAVVAHIRGSDQVRWLGEILEVLNLNQFSQSAAQPGLAVEVIANLIVPVPPVAEQCAIVAQIAADAARLNALRSETERTIALLKERCAALIAAAVTGQLPIVGAI